MAFTDLHEEIEATFARLEGQTSGIAINGGFMRAFTPYDAEKRAGEWGDRVRKDPELRTKHAERNRKRRAERTPEQLEAFNEYRRTWRASKRTGSKTGRPATYDGKAGTGAERARRCRAAKG